MGRDGSFCFFKKKLVTSFMNGTCAAKVSMSSKVEADCMHFLTSWLNCPDFSVFSNNFFTFVSTSLKMAKQKHDMKNT